MKEEFERVEKYIMGTLLALWTVVFALSIVERFASPAHAEADGVEVSTCPDQPAHH